MNYSIENNGSDKWILFIHGLGGSIETWKYQMEDFSGYNILRVDLQGHGNSEFRHSKDPGISSCREINEILEEHGIEKVNVISLSLGTIVAFEFAYLYTDKVESMIMGGSVLNLTLSRKFLVHFVKFFRFFIPGQIMYWLFSFVILPKKNHSKSRKIFVREAMRMKSSAFWSWLNTLNPSKERLAHMFKAVKDNAIKILFISGDEDHMFLPGVRKMHDFLQECKIRFIRKCGHICSIENSKEFDRLSLAFLNAEKH